MICCCLLVLLLGLCCSVSTQKLAVVNVGNSQLTNNANTKSPNGINWNPPNTRIREAGRLDNARSILAGVMSQKLVQQVTEYLFALLTGRLKLHEKEDAAVHGNYIESSEELEDSGSSRNGEVQDYETQVMINDAVEEVKKKTGGKMTTSQMRAIAASFAKQRDEPTKTESRLRLGSNEFSEFTAIPLRTRMPLYKKASSTSTIEREFRRKPIVSLSNTVKRLPPARASLHGINRQRGQSFSRPILKTNQKIMKILPMKSSFIKGKRLSSTASVSKPSSPHFSKWRGLSFSKIRKAKSAPTQAPARFRKFTHVLRRAPRNRRRFSAGYVRH